MTEAEPGILAIFNNAAPGRENEYEEWFQREHLAERLAVPGFLIGRRHEAVSGNPRYFNYYVTRSAEVLKSEVYLSRLNHPTPMTRTVMSEVFRDMNRTVCRSTYRSGAMRGVWIVTLRFNRKPDEAKMTATVNTVTQDKSVACGEVWLAVGPDEFPISEEERLRGGDRKIEACILVETLRLPDAKRVAAALSSDFSQAEIGIYQRLCEIRSSSPALPGC